MVLVLFIRVLYNIPDRIRTSIQETERFTREVLQVNPRTMEQNDGVIGDSAAVQEGDSSRPLTTHLADVTTFPVKGEMFDREQQKPPASTPSSNGQSYVAMRLTRDVEIESYGNLF